MYRGRENDQERVYEKDAWERRGFAGRRLSYQR